VIRTSTPDILERLKIVLSVRNEILALVAELKRKRALMLEPL
jgi:hypothetical protein